MAQQKPPLGLQAELVFPDGSSKRLDCDAKTAADQPTGVSFGTQRYTGFASAQATLNRRIDRDWPDLGLLSGFNLIGYDGSIAYEGRIGSLPRSLEGSPKIMLMAQGYMSHAKDQSFAEVFIDRDLSKWVAPAARRVAKLLGENFALGNASSLNDETGTPVVQTEMAGPWVSPFHPLVEARWLPQAGISLGALYYDLAASSATMSTGDANWTTSATLTGDDNGTVGTSNGTGNVWGALPKTGYLEATGTRNSAVLQAQYAVSPGGAASTTYYARWAKLAVYGTHGLTRRGEDPGGFYVSDMIAAIASKWAPQLDTSRMQQTTFPVPQASFLSETLPYDAFQTLNAYHRWEMAVYEGKRLLYYPIDLNDYDWEVRTTDAGVETSLQGDDLEHLCNGVIVRYTNLATGYEERLTPEAHEVLKDTNPSNPANLYKRKLYTTLALSVPTTEEGALQIGRVYLSEFNQAKAPGSITIKGHIRDRAGHWQQGWKVRSGERVLIADLPNPNVRIIGESSWNHDTKTLSMATDGSFKRLDSILARLGVAVESSNLALP